MSTLDVQQVNAQIANVVSISADHMNSNNSIIKFANASNNPSSDANTLDSYREGTFTPNVTFGGASTGITYAWSIGYYTKIGRDVTVYIDFGLTSKGSATGHFKIINLPFVVGTALNFGGCFTPWMGNMANIVGPITAKTSLGLSNTEFYQTISTGSSTVTCNNTNFTDTSEFRTIIKYFV